MLVFIWGGLGRGERGGMESGRGGGRGEKRELPFLRMLGAVSAETVGVGVMAVIWKVWVVLLFENCNDFSITL